MRLLILISILFCFSNAFASPLFRCLKSAGKGKPIRLQFTFPADDSSSPAQVLYEKGSAPISLKKTQDHAKPNRDRPSEVQMEWIELPESPSSGKYLLTTQGALILSFKYVSAKNAKTFTFKDDPDSVDGDSCSWNSKKH